MKGLFPAWSGWVLAAVVPPRLHGILSWSMLAPAFGTVDRFVGLQGAYIMPDALVKDYASH